MNRITLKDLRSMQSAGKIRGFSEPVKTVNQSHQSKIVAKHFAKKSKEKDWLGWNLLHWANENCLILHEEFRFDKNGRKWRFDWCVPAIKVAVEYNGIFSEKSRHTTATGYTGDMDKLNAAQAAGWRVVQLTPLNYKNVRTELNKFL